MEVSATEAPKPQTCRQPSTAAVDIQVLFKKRKIKKEK